MGSFRQSPQPSPVDHDRAEVAGLLGLIAVAKAEERLRTMSDGEIATLVQDHVWAHESIIDVKSELLSSAIDRLRRADGGPMPEAAALDAAAQAPRGKL